MTAAVLDTRHLPSKAVTTATDTETVDDALVHRIARMNDIFSPTSDDDLKVYSRVLHRPAGTGSSASFAGWMSAPTSTSSSTSTLASIGIPTMQAVFEATYEFVTGPYAPVHTGDAEPAHMEDSMVSIRAAQRKRDRRAAIVAGILSGLGIRPRRPRDPYERMNAALIRASQTELIDARY